VIDSGEREVHRRRLPRLLKLQVALEIAGRVIAGSGLPDRRGRVGASGQPTTIRRDVTGVGLARSRCQRRALQILDVARDRVRDVAIAGLAPVSRSRSGGLRRRHGTISSRIGGRNLRLRCLRSSAQHGFCISSVAARI